MQQLGVRIGPGLWIFVRFCAYEISTVGFAQGPGAWVQGREDMGGIVWRHFGMGVGALFRGFGTVTARPPSLR